MKRHIKMRMERILSLLMTVVLVLGSDSSFSKLRVYAEDETPKVCINFDDRGGSASVSIQDNAESTPTEVSCGNPIDVSGNDYVITLNPPQERMDSTPIVEVKEYYKPTSEGDDYDVVLTSEGEEPSLVLSEKESDSAYTFILSCEDQTEGTFLGAEVNIWWSEYDRIGGWYDSTTGEGEYCIEVCVQSGEGEAFLTIDSDKYYTVWEHSEGEGEAERHWGSHKIMVPRAIVDDENNNVAVKFSPYENYSFGRLQVNNYEGETPLYTLDAADLTTEEEPAYTLKSENFDSNGYLNMEVCFDGGKPSINVNYDDQVGEVDIQGPGYEEKKKISSGSLDKFEFGKEYTFSLVPPENRTKDCVNIVEVRIHNQEAPDSIYSNVGFRDGEGNEVGPNLSIENKAFDVTIPEESKFCGIDVSIWWSEYDKCGGWYDSTTGEGDFCIEVANNGGGEAYVEVMPNEMPECPTVWEYRGQDDQGNEISWGNQKIMIPANYFGSASSITIKFRSYDGSCFESFEVDKGNGNASDIISGADLNPEEEAVYVLSEDLFREEENYCLRTRLSFTSLPSSEGSIEINYDPMSNAKVEYSIGESDYSTLDGHGFINYLDENGNIKRSVKLLVTPPDFYLGKNIEPIMVYPEELSDCVVMTRDGDKYLYTFTPPTDETPSFRVDFIWSDFYAWDIDWSSQFKIESQIVDGNGNIIVSPNPGESNTYRHPEAAQMNGQEIRVFNLNTDITYTLTPNANCYVSEIEIRREAEGSNNIDVAYTFDESQVGGKWVLWDETNPGMVTESTSAEGCYVITIPGSNAWGNYYISVRFKQGQSGIKGGSDDFKGAKKILEGTNFGYAGTKADIEADLEWELWYSYFGYLKSRDSEGTFYGMFGTVNKEDNSKADNGDYRDERKPYAIDYTGPSEAFKNAVTLSEGTSTTGSVVDGLPYYTYMVDFKNCSAWTSGAPESAEGKVYVLSNYTDIVVGFKNDTGVTNYQVVDASLSSFDGRTTVYGDYGESGTVIIFGNGAGSVGSTSREEEKQYRFSIHVTQELSNMHMRRSYQIETAPPQPGSDFNAQVNEGKPGINCNLGIVNTIIEGFEVTPHYEKGTAAAWGWTDWPLYWTNGSSESNPIVFEMYKGCTWLEINSLDNESRPSITNIECTLPYAGKAVKIEKKGTTYKFTLLSDYYDEIPLKITYSNSKVGYATLRFVAIDIQRGRTIWHGTDNSKDAGNDSVITASYYYLSDQTMTVNLFATLTLGDGSVVTKTVTPYGARVTDANQGTNQVDDFIVWKQGDTPSMPIKVEVIAIVPDSGDSFGGALIGSGSGVCKVVE